MVGDAVYLGNARKMSINTLSKLLFISYLLLLGGCGGGGSGGSGGGNPGVTTTKAVLLDGVVQGVRYDAGSGVTGVTDANGVFDYVEGQSVSFYLGNILLGTASPIDKPAGLTRVLADKIVTPLELVGVNANLDDPQVLNRVRLLLTLDADGDPNNGIQIASSVVTALQSTSSLDFGTAFDPTTILQTASNASGQSMVLVDSNTAKQHLCDSLQRDCTSGGGNHAPTISGIPASSVNVGSVYSFTPASTDEDVGDSKTFGINKTPSWATFDTTMGKLSGTPAAADVGTTSGIVISVKDSKDASASLTAFDLTVVQPNRAPTIGGTPATSVDVGSAYSFTPAAEDLDGDAKTFSITNKPSWASFSTSTGALTGTPTAVDVGITSNIIISVTDGKSLSVALPAFNLAVIAPVTPLNLAPYGTATQKSTYNNDIASNGAANVIDGKTDTINHTACQSNDWWQLELKNESLISEITVTNRTSSYRDVRDRLKGATVYLSNTPAASNTWNASELVKTLSSDTDPFAGMTFSVDPARSARYVIVKTNGSACLHMAEVAVKGIVSDTLEFAKTSYAFEVKHRTAQGGAVGTVNAIQYAGRAVTYSIDGTVPFAIDAQGNITVTGELNRETYTFTVKATDGLGTVSVPVTIQAPFNLALEFGVATQSSTYNSSSTAGNAIDDKLETTNHTNCDVGDWWQVKLPDPTLISRIVVTGRDTWTSRLNGAEVYVSANSATNGGMSAGDKVFTLVDTANAQNILLATPKAGTYIIVKAVAKTGGTECLHMREVEAYGQAAPTPVFSQPAYLFNLYEKSPSGTAVGAVKAVDYQKDTVIYRLVGNVPFAIDTQGQITLNGTLNHNLIQSYSFNVEASDGSNVTTVPVTVKLGKGNGTWLQRWDGISGTSVDNLLQAAHYQNDAPDFSGSAAALDAKGISKDNYGQKLTAYLVPAVSGNYQFAIVGDDATQLKLSQNVNASQASKIAENGWGAYQDWNAAGKSVLIALEAGKPYYIEALHKEGTGADYVSVGWKREGEASFTAVPSTQLYQDAMSAGQVKPFFNASVIHLGIPLRTPANTLLGRVQAYDLQGDSMSYSIVENVPFSVDANGKITVTPALNHNVTQAYSFTRRATDGTH